MALLVEVARRFAGRTKDFAGSGYNPLIVSMLRLDGAAGPPMGDDVPWASAFVNFIAFVLGLERSKALAARSWLRIGDELTIKEIEAQSLAGQADIVVVFRCGRLPQPGPDVVDAPGHVAILDSIEEDEVIVIGGTARNEVEGGRFPLDDVLAFREIGRVR